MNKSIIRYILSRVLQFEGVFMLLPCIVALIYGEKHGLYFLATAIVSFALGTLGGLIKPKSTVFYAREGFVTVSLSWILLSLVGAIPFVLTGEIPNYVDALFETVSGFTTTGSTILRDVEYLSKTSQFWRCFIIWIGGMGVLVFIMAILPLSGSYNMHLMRAESTGADVGKLVPKVKNTAKLLYGMYISISCILLILLMIAGLDLYNALLLMFSTVGTGGFCNVNASLGGFSHTVQVITIVFMILCGINFNAYFFLVMRKPKEILKMEEVRYYLGMLFVSTAVITWCIRGSFGSLYEAFHNAIFHAASIVTTTGFALTDYEVWPMLPKAILIMLTVVGACAGATAGGIKVSRFVILLKVLKRELEKLTHPRSVKKVRFNGQTVSEDTVNSIIGFLIAYFFVLIISFLILSINGFDFTTNITAVLTTLSNVGPGLGGVGPAQNFADYNMLSKSVLVIDMLAGRLEILPIFVLLYAGTWKRN
ncbi:MAG: TrkH family potassium uptake protein [Lachnospiraceae bacterium]|nr:TrkH family potassium uptake protein [Lachnospiraceae bacterium]